MKKETPKNLSEEEKKFRIGFFVIIILLFLGLFFIGNEVNKTEILKSNNDHKIEFPNKDKIIENVNQKSNIEIQKEKEGKIKEKAKKESITEDDFVELKKENINNTKEIVEKKLNASERIAIILDEKKRLKKIENRRVDDGLTDLTKNYIRNTPYTEYIKGLMREASYYIQLLITNYKNEDIIRGEADNIAWNAICLNTILKEHSPIVISMLQISIYDTETEEEFNYFKGSELLTKIFAESNETPTKEEINIRCLQVNKITDETPLFEEKKEQSEKVVNEGEIDNNKKSPTDLIREFKSK